MSCFNGKHIKVEILGESHSAYMSVKGQNFPDFKVDKEKLYAFLERRKAVSKFSTPRKEKDFPVFESENVIENGEFNAKIFNENVKSNDYDNLYGKPRPSHADYSWYLKDEQLNFSGGGRFSGRLTAMLCIAGGIAKQYLESKGVKIYSFISQINGVKGKSFTDGATLKEVENANLNPCYAISNGEKMLERIEKARSQGDSVGGVAEVIVYDMIKGIGDNLFDGLENKIAYSLFSVPAVKGVEFGSGFDGVELLASEVNDQMAFKDGKVEFLSNNSGGITGGISNGQPINVKIAVKPTPTIFKEQQTVDLVNKETVKIKAKGRHDSCILLRALPCLESAVALAILDEIL